MSVSHTAASRRLIRRRRHVTPWQGAQAWLRLIYVRPSRAPQHVLALSLGITIVLATGLWNRPTVAPAASPADPAVADLAASEPLSEAPPLAAPAPPSEAAPHLTTYVVEPGDTLRALADRFGVSVATLVAANKLADPDLIGVGQELVVLPTNGVLHTISPGETLGQVASRYGVDATALASVNQVAPLPDQPVAGEKLVVPGIEPALPAPKPKSTVARARGASQEQSAERVSSLASLNVQSDEEAGEATDEAVAESPEKPAAQSKAPAVYEVQDGDTIRSLANQFGVSIQTILVANNITDPDLITPGTKLKVLPVTGVEHEVGKGESLADIAAAYKVDLGPIVDFNGLADPDMIRVGDKVLIPGATTKVTVPVAAPPAPRVSPASPSAAVAALPAPQTSTSQSSSSTQAAIRPATQAAAPAAAAAAPAVRAPAVTGSGAGGIVKIAMSYLGYHYVFGGSSPAGFDCSGFVWYIHKSAGIGISRGMWGQYGGGPRISRDNLQPGDTVFFANTYMPGLSHVGIYIGGGQFIHAVDESQGVAISSMNSSYWGPRYVGAARLY